MITVKELCIAYLEPHDDCTIDSVNTGKTVYDGSVMEASNGKYSDFIVESFSSTGGGICINVDDSEATDLEM